MRAAQGGDGLALDALLRRHYDRIYAVCRRITGNEADAQDAAQDALLALAKGIRRFDGRAAFSTWAYRVTTNACLDELRRRRRRPAPGLPEAHGEVSDGGAGISLGAPSADIEGYAERLAIEAALSELSEEFRVAVVLRDIADLDYAEIAEVLDIPPGTVRSRIARGRSQLADRLAEGNQGPRVSRPRGQRSPTPPAGSAP